MDRKRAQSSYVPILPSTNRRLRRLVVGFFLLALLLTSVFIFLPPGDLEVHRPGLLAAVGGGLILLVVLALLPWQDYPDGYFLPVSLLGAAGLTVAVYLSGGGQSPLALFYPLIIVLSPVFMSGRYSQWAGLTASLMSLAPALYDPGPDTTRTLLVLAPMNAILAVYASAVADSFVKEYLAKQFLSLTDPLTGLFNSRHLMERLPAEIKRARRYGHSLALLLLDSDSLKQVNDRYGHQMGDELVKSTARMLRRTVRETDITFRYAGDEFVVIMPETSLEEAVQAAERIRAQIAEVGLDGEGEWIAVTASIGVAVFPEDGETPEELLRAADRAMYQAKRAGKNAVRSRSAQAQK